MSGKTKPCLAEAGMHYTITSGDQTLDLTWRSCEVGLVALRFTGKGCFACATPSCVPVGHSRTALPLRTRKTLSATCPCLRGWLDKCYRAPQTTKWP